MPDLFDRLKTILADRYAIEEEIGAGGMATVCLAEDLKHDRQVAVKVLRPVRAEPAPRARKGGATMSVLRITVLFLVVPSIAHANEGWWTRSRIAGGSLYSEVEHPLIALEKEVLIYHRDGLCEAHFLFRNTDAASVTVRIAFPIKITVPLDDLGYDILDPGRSVRPYVGQQMFVSYVDNNVVYI